MRVCTTGDYKPFSYRTNANSPFIGFDIDMAQGLAKQLGVKLELVPTSWPSLMNDLAAGRFDAFFEKHLQPKTLHNQTGVHNFENLT